jgi:hypothetical protein
MFRNNTNTIAEPTSNVEEHPADDLHVGCDLVPLTVLALDLGEPSVGGRDAYLSGRGIPVVLDDIGRKAISRADARQLFDERREDEIRRREVAVRQEQQAIERDQQWRAQLPGGVPWYEIPPGVIAAEAWAQGEGPPAQTVGARGRDVQLGDDPPPHRPLAGWG